MDICNWCVDANLNHYSIALVMFALYLAGGPSTAMSASSSLLYTPITTVCIYHIIPNKAIGIIKHKQVENGNLERQMLTNFHPASIS